MSDGAESKAREDAEATARHELRRLCTRTSVPRVVVFDAGCLGLLVATWSDLRYVRTWVQHRDVIQIKKIEEAA